ncbi:MAG: helix-turn-helix domain-containing protein [Gammaproteobacteria bacterium]
MRDSLQAYLDDLDGHEASNIFQMVICEVEPPLLEVVMKHAGGNTTRAAQILGINRTTLRKELKNMT